MVVKQAATTGGERGGGTVGKGRWPKDRGRNSVDSTFTSISTAVTATTGERLKQKRKGYLCNDSGRNNWLCHAVSCC